MPKKASRDGQNDNYQWDVFLSYASEDKSWCEKLAERLVDKGVRVWFDGWILRPGHNIGVEINKAIETSRKMVAVWSSHYFEKEWTQAEAFGQLHDDPLGEGRHVIPVIIDDYTNLKIPPTLRPLLAIDFVNSSDFELHFRQLIQSLDLPELSRLENSEDTFSPLVTPIHTLRAHSDVILRVDWNHDGTVLASSSVDHTFVLWNPKTGQRMQMFDGHSQGVNQVAFEPNGSHLASCSHDRLIRVWDLRTGLSIHELRGHLDDVPSIAMSPDGTTLASSSEDATIRLWDMKTGQTTRILERHKSGVSRISWTRDGRWLASCSNDGMVIVWDCETWTPLRELSLPYNNSPTSVAWSPDGKMLVVPTWGHTIHVFKDVVGDASGHAVVLQGHTGMVRSATFSFDQRLLASSSQDGTVRLWRTDAWQQVATILEPVSDYWPQGIAFHPTDPVLATFGEKDRIVRLWTITDKVLDNQAAEQERRVYRNAKVVLLGDSGVGKSGLRIVLTNEAYHPTDSTYGRRVWALDSHEFEAPDRRELRETFIWDMAGQSGYRLLHQLHIDQVSVALLVFDAKQRDADPLAAVRYWERALRQSRQREGDSALPLTKILVVARNDVAGVPINNDRIEAAKRDLGFAYYISTSAKENIGIRELAEAIRRSIPWESLPEVVSPRMFEKIKKFLLAEKDAARLLVTEDDLYRNFVDANPDERSNSSLRDTFHTCVVGLQNVDLVRILRFGGFVLLRPDRLDAYASAIIQSVERQTDPQRSGSIPLEDARAGRFDMPASERLKDPEEEQLLLIQTVEELLRHQLVLREESDEGPYLVFPSQFNRDWPEAAAPIGTALTMSFQGPVQNVYATLAVRLAHSGIFQTRREEMWRNAVVYTTKFDGGECGLFLKEYKDGLGELTLFFREDQQKNRPTRQTQNQFEGFVKSHLEKRAQANSVRVTRLFTCPNCHSPIPQNWVEMRRSRNFDWIECGCGERVSIAEPQVQFERRREEVAKMDASADRKREQEVGETVTFAKTSIDEYDVFLCHNSRDKSAVIDIGMQLKKKGIRPWLDQWDLQPGDVWQDHLDEVIAKVKAAAVFVGANGSGPWEVMETRFLLRRFVNGGLRVIPVVLPEAQTEPQWSGFLDDFHRVDFRISQPDPMEQLCWGITGKRLN